MGKFEDLIVWQRSKDLSVRIYRVTLNGPIDKDFGLKDQIRRAAVSIPSNIAEGDESGTNRMAVKYFHMAKGSLA
jgi:four helix bundle protein